MSMMPKNGTILNSAGEPVNWVDALSGGVKTGERYNMDTIAPMTGEFLNSAGEAVNIADALIAFLSGGSGGGGGAVSLQTLTITVNGTTYTYDGKNPVTVEIPEPVTPEPAQALNITINGKRYSYDGSTQIDIVMTAAEEGTY